jgi:hypothetical protein
MIAGGILHAKTATAPADPAPYWVFVASYSAMAFGTAIGGWRIVKTMGMRLTKLRPVGGFCAEVAGAITLFGATYMHIPVSTTHTITGAVVGVGATRRLSAVRWGVAGRIVWAWVLTIPAAGLVAAVTYAITVSRFALLALVLAAVAVGLAVLAARRTREPRPPVGADPPCAWPFWTSAPTPSTWWWSTAAPTAPLPWSGASATPCGWRRRPSRR